jgi:hypothetical protein
MIRDPSDGSVRNPTKPQVSGLPTPEDHEKKREAERLDRARGLADYHAKKVASAISPGSRPSYPGRARPSAEIDNGDRMTMANGLPTVNLHLAEAQSCITVARALLAEKLHKDDRKQIEELLAHAESKMDTASAVLGNLRARLDDVRNQL